MTRTVASYVRLPASVRLESKLSSNRTSKRHALVGKDLEEARIAMQRLEEPLVENALSKVSVCVHSLSNLLICSMQADSESLKTDPSCQIQPESSTTTSADTVRGPEKVCFQSLFPPIHYNELLRFSRKSGIKTNHMSTSISSKNHLKEAPGKP